MPSAAEIAFAITAKNETKDALSAVKGDLDSTAKSADDAGGHFAGLKEHLGAVADVMGGLLGAQALGGLSGAITGSIGAANGLGASVKELQDRIGGTAEDSSRLIFAFQQYGLSSDQAQTSLDKFSKGIKGFEDNADGTTKKSSALTDQLKALGVTTETASGSQRSMNDILGDVADKFQNMPDGPNKTALAMQLFGKSGTDLIPILDQGRGGMAALGAESDKLGHTLSEGQLAAMHQNTLETAQLHAATEGLRIQLGVALLPVLTSATEFLTGLATAVVEHVIPGMQSFSGELEEHLGPVIKNDVIPIITQLWNLFTTLMSGPIGMVISGVQVLVGNWGTLVKAFPALGEAWDTIQPKLQQLSDWFSKNLGAAIAAVGPMFQQFGQSLSQNLLPILTQAFSWLGSHESVLLAIVGTAGIVGLVATIGAIPVAIAAISAAVVALVTHWGDITSAVGNFIDAVEKRFPEVGVFITQVQNFFTGLWVFISQQFVPGVTAGVTAIVDFIQEHWAGIKDLLTGPFEIARDLIKGVLEAVRDILSTAFTVLGDVLQTFGDLFHGNWSKLWDDVKQIFSDVWDGIKQLLGDELNTIKNLLGDAWDTIKATVKETWEGIKSLLGDATGGILGGIHDGITGAWNAIKTAVGDATSGVLGGISDGIKAAWNGVKTLLGDAAGGLLGGIHDAITGAWDDIKKLLGDAAGGTLGAIHDAIKAAWDDVTKLLGDLSGGILGTIHDAITGAWNDVKKLLGDAAGGILGGIHDGIKAAWDDVTKLLGDATGGILGTIHDAITGAWDSIKKLLGDAAGGTLGAIHDAITSAWNDIKSLLGDAAGGILGGIKDGITGAFDAAKTALGDTASGILGGIHTAITGAWNDVKTFLGNAKDDIVTFLEAPFKAFSDNIGGIMKTAGNALLQPLRDVLSGFNAFLGGIRDAVNWVSGKLDLGDLISGSFSVPTIPMLAEGTPHFAGGLALVGEEGPELVHLPQGAAVLPAGPTQALRESGQIPGFFLGINPGAVLDALKSAWSHIEAFAKEWLAKGADKLVDTAFSAVGLKDLHFPGVLGELGGAIGTKIKDGVVEGIKELLGLVDQAKPQVAAEVSGAQASEQVAAWIRAAMKQANAPDDWFQGLVFINSKEDPAGDPSILGNDPNDPTHPPVGLMQVKPYNYSIAQLQDPVFNVVAAIEYIRSRYGTPYNQKLIDSENAGIGYANGGIIDEPIWGVGASGRRYQFGERGPETVTPGVGGAGGTELHIHIHALDTAGVRSAVPELTRLISKHLIQIGQPPLVPGTR